MIYPAERIGIDEKTTDEPVLDVNQHKTAAVSVSILMS